MIWYFETQYRAPRLGLDGEKFEPEDYLLFRNMIENYPGHNEHLPGMIQQELERLHKKKYPQE